MSATTERGRGVVVRHSRRCATKFGSAACSCEPSFNVWVYISASKRKRWKTFHDIAAASDWRLAELRRIYGKKAAAAPPGRLDSGYSLLRKAAQEIDRARPNVAPNQRGIIRDALDEIYRAEDLVLQVLSAAW